VSEASLYPDNKWHYFLT